MATVRKSVQPPVDLLCPRPASVRALISVLWIERQPVPLRFHSFRTPGRAHPVHPLSHLPRPMALQLPPMVPYSVSYGGQRSPSAESGVSAAVKCDMQGNEIAISSMGLGKPRFAPAYFGGGLCEEARHYRARGQSSGYQCEVLLYVLLRLWVGTDSCPLKVHDIVYRVG